MCEKLTVEEFMKEYERTKKPCIFFRREKTIMIEFAKAYVEKTKLISEKSNKNKTTCNI